MCRAKFNSAREAREDIKNHATMKIAVLLVAAAAADATSIGAHKSSSLRRRLNGTEDDGGGDLFIDFDEGPPTFPPMDGPVPGAVVMTGEDPLVGADYCAWAPAYDCYIDGWPTCCPKILGGEPCPVEQPPCEFGVLDGPVLGASYCTYGPDYDCYVDGWPSCCVAPGGEGDPCPEDRPPCELEEPIEEPSCDANAPCEVEGSVCASGTESCCGETYDSLECECMPNEDGKPTWACYATEACFLPSCENDEPVLGADYCTYGPDYDCYESGWPSCCSTADGEGDPCPEDRPPCELGEPIDEPSCEVNAPCKVEGSNCASGTESCCGETYDSLECECMPNEDGKPTWACYATEACFLPSCENDEPVLGADYCTYGPDYDCYESGWPSCCSTADGEGDPCPDTQPSCEVTATTTWTTTTTTTETPDSPSTTTSTAATPDPDVTTTTTATTIARSVTPSPTPAPDSAAFAMTSLHSLTVLLAFFTAHRLW